MTIASSKITPPFTSVNEILNYLRTCDHRYDHSPNGRLGRWVFRIWLVCAFVFFLAIMAIFGLGLYWSHGETLSEDHRKTIDIALDLSWLFLIPIFVFGIWALRIAWPEFRRTRSWTFDVVGHDEGNATPLISATEALLTYSKEWVKRKSDRWERNINAWLGVPSLVSLFGFFGASVGVWKLMKAALKNGDFKGLNLDVIYQSGPVVIAIFVALILIRVSIVKVKVGHFSYQCELLDIALRLKEVQKKPEFWPDV